MGVLITMSEFLHRVAHAIFKKQLRTDGTDRDTDRLFDSFGASLGAARDDIVTAARMMHPDLAEGSYLDDWGRSLGGLVRLPGESDTPFRALLATAGEFWTTVGTTGFFGNWLARLGWEAHIEPHPTRWAVRVVSVYGWSGITRWLQVVHDLTKFRAAHYLYLIDLWPPVGYAGTDYQPGYADWTGCDERPGTDWFRQWES